MIISATFWNQKGCDRNGGGSCDGSVTVMHSLDYLIHHPSRCSTSLCGNEEFNI